ncbi:MAG: preprotein translocase subunit YajC [Candidatus Muproteobacteria bacterium RIFCSPHIGHO2_01_FULL_61_200]|nr:MAG: preprotein translocase subunit YajC [Candidatus Muproteobacteria bacterium RIFCSPHIGHO2_01_FULL_61_200]
MNLFISEAWAQAPAAPAGAPAQGSPFMTLIMLGVLFAAFYFILIRPQAKRAKEHKALIAALAKGDEVVTGGGVLGKVTNLSDVYVTVEIADGVEIKVQRQAVQTVLPKGTIKSA